MTGQGLEKVVLRAGIGVLDHPCHPPVETTGDGCSGRPGRAEPPTREIGEEGIAIVCGELVGLLALGGLVALLGGGDACLQALDLREQALPAGHGLELLEDDVGQAGALFAGFVQRPGDRHERGFGLGDRLALLGDEALDFAQAVLLRVEDGADVGLHLGEGSRDRLVGHPRQVKLGQGAEGRAAAFAGLGQLLLEGVDALLFAVELAADPADARNEAVMDVFAGLHGYHSVIWPTSG